MTTHKHLTWAQKLALAAYIKDHYTASTLCDPYFADAAAKALGFTISRHNVNSIRVGAGIPANDPLKCPMAAAARRAGQVRGAQKRSAHRSPPAAPPPDRLDEIEASIKQLRDQLYGELRDVRGDLHDLLVRLGELK